MGPTEGNHSRPADPAIGCLQADDAAQGCRTANRPTGAGTQCGHRLTRSHGGPGSAAGSPGDVGQVPGIAGRREGGGEVRTAQSKLMHRQLTQKNTSGGFEPGRGRGIFRRHTVNVHLRARSRGDTGGVVQVFEGKRNAVQRPLVVATAYLGFSKPGVVQCLFFQYDDERMKPVVGGFDAV